MSCQHTMTLGVYLLGALDPGERAEFEAHLAVCDTCRAELVRLSPLPGLLNQVSPADFADAPPAGAGAPVTAPAPVLVREPVGFGDVPAGGRPVAPGPRRRWRVAAAFVGVVVLVAAGLFGWRAIREVPAPPAAGGVVWSASAGPLRAEARLIDHEWGTEIQSKVEGLPPGRQCYLVVVNHYGDKEQAGWWGTDHDPSEEIPGSTSFRRSKIERLEFLLDNREVALTLLPPTR